MRTTVEIPDQLRARLLALAARRGEKGYSRLVEEAIARYVDEWEGRAKVVREAGLPSITSAWHFSSAGPLRAKAVPGRRTPSGAHGRDWMGRFWNGEAKSMVLLRGGRPGRQVRAVGLFSDSGAGAEVGRA